mgnify:CR=1 FL=1
MSSVDFASLGIAAPVLKAVMQLGYEQPSPVQAASIPILLTGKNLLGTAQTGTGKTAAFALPFLSQLDEKQKTPQVLVLTPTRELAIQVAEAFQSYAKHIKGFHVLPIYGGADIGGQLRGLKRGAQVVVGTPGRMLDHLRRRSLDLSQIKGLILDEADEMLRMGFIDDVETILAKTPPECQRALFSATMPPAIKRVADKYLGDAELVSIENKTKTVERIAQAHLMVKGHQKMDALTRILEVEQFDGMIIFVRTKSSTLEIAEKLEARGFSSAALNGDLTQAVRERTINRLKKGQLDIVVATDVAARGLDVERITHVINYDVPFDEEAYVHRIGRTGRAGRKGKAILFVVPRERRMLRNIERLTRQSIPEIKLPSVLAIDAKRREAFADSIRTALTDPMQAELEEIIDTLNKDSDYRSIAVALAGMLHSPGASKGPKHAKGEKHTPYGTRDARDEKSSKPNRKERRQGLQKKAATSESETPSAPKNEKHLGEARPLRDHPDVPMERFRVEVGRKHGVKPGELMGAIANEAGIEGQYIGMINILEECSTIDLPEGIPKSILKHLKKTRVKGVHLAMGRVA